MVTISPRRPAMTDANRPTDGANALPIATTTSEKSNASQAVVAQKFDLAIALILASWSALTVAVQNQWGGPDSADKRDWLAGAISDLFATTPETDEADIEDMLLQVMRDEFDLQLEDDSEIQVASNILKARKLTMEGRFAEVDQLYENWAERQKKGDVRTLIQVQEREDEVHEGEWASDSDDEDENEGGVSMDVDMDDAPPQLIIAKPKPMPQVDQDGFTKVVSKKKR